MTTYQAPIPPVDVPRPPQHESVWQVRATRPRPAVQDTVTPTGSSAGPSRTPGLTRSLPIAIVLAALFGPIGLLYSSVLGAAITSAIYLALTLPVVVFWPPWAFVTLGLLLPLCVVWAVVACLGREAVAAWRTSAWARTTQRQMPRRW